MQIDPMAPDRPALRYHGAKWRLARWIIPQLPGHKLYCEPFGGSGAVLLRKPRSNLEVYNDLDGEVVNFFRVIRDEPVRLIQAIKLTPFAKAEWELSFEHDPDPLERARRFYIRSYMSIAGPTAQSSTGWRRQKVLSRGANGESKRTPAAITFAKTEHLHQVADRLRGVTIECDKALEIIRRYDSPETVFYCDPPYVPETRGHWKRHAYLHEMDEEDHRYLALLLERIEGMAIISGYRCALYDELYEDWQRGDKRTRINGPGSAVESLWLNPAAVERRKHTDLPLFQEKGNGH